MNKKLLAAILSLCLMLSLLPTAALASGLEPNEPEPSEQSSNSLSDGTSIDSTSNITRAQMAEMIYEHPSLNADIDTMAMGGAEPDFNDIGSCTDDQKAAITALYRAKILSGTTETTFDPTGTVTRGEFAVVLWRATGCRSNKTAMEGQFTDTLEIWYAPAVNCFYGAGLVSGTAEGTFDGGTEISVAGVNTFLTAYAANKDMV